MSNKAHLKKVLTPIHIWAFGVGLVISGDYFGWNYGLLTASPLIMLLTVLFVGLFYLSFIFCYTELVSMVPNSGGPFSFAAAAFGNKIGIIAGAATLIEFLFAPPAIALAIGSYIHYRIPTFQVEHVAIIVFIIFGLLNCIGMMLAANFELIVTLLATIELFIFFGLTSTHIELSKLLVSTSSHSVPFQFYSALPFAIWFFLGIEGVAMCVEEAKDPHRSMPIGLITSIVTLVILALGVIITATGILTPDQLVKDDSPLPHVLATVLSRNSIFTHMLVYLGVFGLMASFHGIILGASRQVYALSRARLLPHQLSYISPKFMTPIWAVIACCIIGIICIIVGNTEVLVSISCLGAALIYVISLLSFLKLKFSQTKNAQEKIFFKAPLFPILPIISTLCASIILILSLIADREVSLMFVIMMVVVVLISIFFHKR